MELSVVDKLRNIVFALAIYIAWTFLIGYIISSLAGDRNYYHHNTYVFDLNYLFYACILAPLWEELLFRKVPITIANIINPKLLWPVIIMSSAIFGWSHGDGMRSLLLQGVLGVTTSYVYIKNGNSYWSIVIIHSSWNLLVPYLSI